MRVLVSVVVAIVVLAAAQPAAAQYTTLAECQRAYRDVVNELSGISKAKSNCMRGSDIHIRRAKYCANDRRMLWHVTAYPQCEKHEEYQCDAERRKDDIYHSCRNLSFQLHENLDHLEVLKHQTDSVRKIYEFGNEVIDKGMTRALAERAKALGVHQLTTLGKEITSDVTRRGMRKLFGSHGGEPNRSLTDQDHALVDGMLQKLLIDRIRGTSPGISYLQEDMLLPALSEVFAMGIEELDMIDSQMEDYRSELIARTTPPPPPEPKPQPYKPPPRPAPAPSSDNDETETEAPSWTSPGSVAPAPRPGTPQRTIVMPSPAAPTYVPPPPSRSITPTAPVVRPSPPPSRPAQRNCFNTNPPSCR